MALGVPPPGPDAWGRWPQQQQQQQHSGVGYADLNPGIVPYDTRSGATLPVHRPELPHHFFPAAFTPNQMPSVPSPHYQSPIPHSTYVSYSSLPMLDAPVKPEPFPETPQPHGLVHNDAWGGRRESWASMSTLVDRSRSLPVKSETNMSSAESTASNSSTSSKTIVANVRAEGAPVHEPNTTVDNLMKVLQSKLGSIGHQENNKSERVEKKTEDIPASQQQQCLAKPKRKQFRCDIPGCEKAFAQKNNLVIHRRAHTGEEPYVCTVPNCRRRFTQRVNLKTHLARHNGERPYACHICGKAFPQRSNVKAHLSTHERRKPFLCKIDGCNKAFSVKGNLKQHQNNFHVGRAQALAAKVASMTDESALTPEDRDMIQYMLKMHNNANKGIKGRGKGRTVERLLQPLPYLVFPHGHPQQQQQQQQQQPLPPAMSPVSSASSNSGISSGNSSGNSNPIHHVATTTSSSSTSSMSILMHQHHQQQQQQQQLPQLQTQAPPQPVHGLPLHGLSSSQAAYSMTAARQPGMLYFSLPVTTAAPGAMMPSTMHPHHHHHHAQQQQQQQQYDDVDGEYVFIDRL